MSKLESLIKTMNGEKLKELVNSAGITYDSELKVGALRNLIMQNASLFGIDDNKTIHYVPLEVLPEPIETNTDKADPRDSDNPTLAETETETDPDKARYLSAEAAAAEAAVSADYSKLEQEMLKLASELGSKTASISAGDKRTLFWANVLVRMAEQLQPVWFYDEARTVPMARNGITFHLNSLKSFSFGLLEESEISESALVKAFNTLNETRQRDGTEWQTVTRTGKEAKSVERRKEEISGAYGRVVVRDLLKNLEGRGLTVHKNQGGDIEGFKLDLPAAKKFAASYPHDVEKWRIDFMVALAPQAAQRKDGYAVWDRPSNGKILRKLAAIILPVIKQNTVELLTE